MGGLLTLPSFLHHFPEIDTANPPPGSSAGHASNIQGITVGGYTLGCFFGAVATIWLGNLLGRKRTIFVGSTIMIIGAVLQASSYSLGQLIPARLITGFGNGMNTSTVPTWQAETSKSHRRGQMVMIEGSLIVFGVMLSYWLDLGFSFLEPSTSHGASPSHSRSSSRSSFSRLSPASRSRLGGSCSGGERTKLSKSYVR
jgi:MFS family permease